MLRDKRTTKYSVLSKQIYKDKTLSLKGGNNVTRDEASNTQEPTVRFVRQS
jgi:hypothetical protein